MSVGRHAPVPLGVLRTASRPADLCGHCGLIRDPAGRLMLLPGCQERPSPANQTYQTEMLSCCEPYSGRGTKHVSQTRSFLMIGYLIPVSTLFLRIGRKHASCQESVAARAGSDEMLKPAISGNRDLRFPVAGISRKTSWSQNIKFDVEWYVGLVENEINSGFAASSDFGQFYLMPLYRNSGFAAENSPKLVAAKK